MPSFPAITVRQPPLLDPADDPVGVSGVGTGFESVRSARVRDGYGAERAAASPRTTVATAPLPG